MRIETLDGKTIEARPQQLLNYRQFTNGRVQGYLNECEVKYDDVSGNVYLDTGMMYFQGLAIYVETPQIMFHENDINNLSYVFIVIDNGELSFKSFSNVYRAKVDDILNDPYGKVEIPLALIEKDTLSNKIIDITQTYKYSRKKLRDKPILGTFNKNIFDINTRTYLYSVYIDGYEHRFEHFKPNAMIDITDKVGKILIISWDNSDGSFVWKNSNYDKTNRLVTLFPYLIGDDFESKEIIIGQVKYDYDLGKPYIDYFVDNIYDIPELYNTLDTGWLNLSHIISTSDFSSNSFMGRRIGSLVQVRFRGESLISGDYRSTAKTIVSATYYPLEFIPHVLQFGKGSQQGSATSRPQLEIYFNTTGSIQLRSNLPLTSGGNLDFTASYYVE